MLLKFSKKGQTEIKIFNLQVNLIVFLLLLICFMPSCYGISKKSNESLNLKDKLRLKINYNDSPNSADFFINTFGNEYPSLFPFNHPGLWIGSFTLDMNSIFWMNNNLDIDTVNKLVGYDTYDVGFKFNLLENNKLLLSGIVQQDVNYTSCNSWVINEKQLNYWAVAVSKSWQEVIRGKIFKKNDNELLTYFQTTVYEDKIPIYAFRGEVVLKKAIK